jgi:hypothetical protein
MSKAGPRLTLIRRGCALLGILAVTCPVAVHAALVSENSVVYGSNTLTLDTTTKLEWLDLNLSTGLSINQVTGRLGAGQQFDGFRYATNAEITTLFLSGGITAPLWYSQDALDLANTLDLINLLGITYSDNGNYIVTEGWEADTNGFAGSGWAYAAYLSLQTQNYTGAACQPAGCASALAAGFATSLPDGANQQLSGVGSFLVRDTSSAVPEPDGLALMITGLGLIGFVARRRNKSTT